MRPGRPVIGRGGESNIRRAAIVEPSSLEYADNRRAESITGGFDLSLVLAGCIAEIVAADLRCWDLGSRRAGHQQERQHDQTCATSGDEANFYRLGPGQRNPPCLDFFNE